MTAIAPDRRLTLQVEALTVHIEAPKPPTVTLPLPKGTPAADLEALADRLAERFLKSWVRSTTAAIARELPAPRPKRQIAHDAAQAAADWLRGPIATAYYAGLAAGVAARDSTPHKENVR